MRRVILVVAYFLTLLHAKPLTESPRTVSTTPPTNIPPRKQGCEYNGQIYAPGETFNEGTDGFNWCYGLLCLEDGSITSWDNFECGARTAPPRTTISPATTGLFTSTLPTTTTPKTSSQKTTLPTTTPPTTTPTTTTPPTTTPPTTTSATPSPRVPGCEYNGQFYAPGARFNEGTDGLNWCYGLLCFEDGSIASWDNFECGTMTTPPPTTIPPTTTVPSTVFTATKPKTNSLSTQPKTTPPTATTPTATPPTTSPLTTSPGCEYNGQFYSPGESFNEGTDGRNWCYGLLCQDDGSIISWDNFQCGTTITPLTTTSPSTTNPSTSTQTTTTIPTQPKTTPSRTTLLTATLPRTNPATTTPPTTTPSTPTTVAGCEYGGQFYSPGESFNEGTDGRNWCYGLLCQDDGSISSWDNFQCGTTTTPLSTTTPSTTTPSTTTTSTLTTVPGCEYEGQIYSPGQSFGEGKDDKGWCYGLYCDTHGRVVEWEDPFCETRTTSPTTFPPAPTSTPSLRNTFLSHTAATFPPVSTKAQSRITKLFKKTFTRTNAKVLPISRLLTTRSLSSRRRCFHEGKYYKNGDIVSRMYHGWNFCSGWICVNGRLESWSDFNCANPTTPSHHHSSTASTSKSPEEVSQCYHDGTFYENNDIVTLDPDLGSGGCNVHYCNNGVLVPWNGAECGDTAQRKSPPTDKPDAKASMSDTIPSPSSSQTLPTELADTPKPITTLKTTTIVEGPDATKPPTSSLCLYEGKFYEEGDIISSNFDDTKWCSGWYCKDGNILPWSCDNETSSATTVSATKEKDKPESVTTQTTLGPEPRRCLHEGKYYEESDFLPSDFDGEDWCTGLLCKEGEMVAWDNCVTGRIKLESTLPPATSPTLSTEDTTTKTSAPETELASEAASLPVATEVPGVTQKSTETTISPSITDTTTSITDIPQLTTTTTTSAAISASTTGLNPSTTAIPTTTDTTRSTLIAAAPTTDIPTSTTDTISTTDTPETITTPAPSTELEKIKCYYKGSLYPPGEITQGVFRDGRCFGIICDISGVIVQWVTKTCKPSVPPTLAMTATLPGCLYNDKYFPPGRLSHISDGSGWCLEVICKEDGRIISRSKRNCEKERIAATTTAKPKVSTADIKMCHYNGMKYYPGIINKGVGVNGWCYKVICQDNGKLYLWGDWNCATDAPMTTPPKPTTPPSTCFYNGKSYPAGEITKGKNASGWCYGVTCRPDGQVVLWGSFKCTQV